MSHAEYLAGLDEAALTSLLQRCPEVLVEPAPRSFRELAQRLDAAESQRAALERVNGDEAAVMREISLGSGSVDAVARLCDSPTEKVGEIVDGLCERGLGWRLDDRVGLPDRLAMEIAADLDGFLSLAALTGRMRVEDLRTAVMGLGGDPAGLRKPELVTRLEECYADPARVARTVVALPKSAQARLEQLLARPLFMIGYELSTSGPMKALLRAGLVLPFGFGAPVLPREVAAALLRAHAAVGLRGRPSLAASSDVPDGGRSGAESALLALTTLLDEARHRPLAALKKGGVGARERSRLSGKVGITEPALWIDVAAAAGLLERVGGGYAPTDAYDGWREETSARRWAEAALAWFALDVAPTDRASDDGEVSPPEPMESAAGLMRRALLRAAAGGLSVKAAAAEIDWFCPLHPFTPHGVERMLAAAQREAALLGVVVGDRLSTIGENLVALADHPDHPAAAALGTACAELVPEARSLLVLQSDLTAVVSGQPSATAARLLAAAAVPESRGAATTWRFSPASVRAALDAGWTAEALTAELDAATDRPLPQPLTYLIADVARRHGAVRVRGARCCITGTEAEVAEILATRTLAALHLSRVASTALVSPFELDDVVARLRKAGFAPMPEDATGTVILPERAAPARTHRAGGPRARRRIPAAELAAQLRTGRAAPRSRTHARLAELAPHLAEAEIALLADALDRAADIRISYCNRAGNRSIRTIRPEDLYDRWLSSWCHLRQSQRDFAVAGIQSVSPVG